MNDELKVVITLKGQAASIGVQSPDCDPIFSKIEGDLPAALESVPGLVEEARRSWESNPRYPKCETPLSSQAAPPPQPRSAPRATSSQPAMF